MELGQIHIKTDAGKALVSILLKDLTITKVLDIGCWNGMGTTLCVMQAMEMRKKPLSCLSLEANKMLWEKAVNNWKFKAHPDNLRILYGRVAKTMMTRFEVESHPLFEKVKQHYDMYYEQDRKDFQSAPLMGVRDVDLAILDGGEFCGEADLDAVLEMNPRYIFLDDVEVIKNISNAVRLGKMGWEMIWFTKERNGSVLFRKKKT